MQRKVEETLGGFLKRVMEEKGYSGNALAQATGIAEGSIRNLLKHGLDPDAPAPHPHNLRALAEFLGVRTTWLFELAGYLTPADTDRTVSALGEYIGTRVEALRPEQQTMLLDMLATLEKSASTPNYSQTLMQFLPMGKTLRQRHLSWLENLDRRLASLFGLKSEETLLSGIERRLNILLPQAGITRTQIQQVTQHPVSMALLTILLPRKDIPTGLEKLYYVTYFNEEREIEPAEKDAIIDAWQLLVEAAR